MGESAQSYLEIRYLEIDQRVLPYSLIMIRMKIQMKMALFRNMSTFETKIGAKKKCIKVAVTH